MTMAEPGLRRSHPEVWSGRSSQVPLIVPGNATRMQLHSLMGAPRLVSARVTILYIILYDYYVLRLLLLQLLYHTMITCYNTKYYCHAWDARGHQVCPAYLMGLACPACPACRVSLLSMPRVLHMPGVRHAKTRLRICAHGAFWAEDARSVSRDQGLADCAITHRQTMQLPTGSAGK